MNPSLGSRKNKGSPGPNRQAIRLSVLSGSIGRRYLLPLSPQAQFSPDRKWLTRQHLQGPTERSGGLRER